MSLRRLCCWGGHSLSQSPLIGLETGSHSMGRHQRLDYFVSQLQFLTSSIKRWDSVSFPSRVIGPTACSTLLLPFIVLDTSEDVHALLHGCGSLDRQPHPSYRQQQGGYGGAGHAPLYGSVPLAHAHRVIWLHQISPKACTRTSSAAY